MARKIRELIAELERAGFATRSGKGSHRIFIHKNCPMNLPAASFEASFGEYNPERFNVVISGKSGADVLPYQETAIKRALREVKK